MKISIRTLASALDTQTEVIRLATAIDEWRQDTGAPNLLDIDPSLVAERPSPPSKFNGMNTGDYNSVWRMLHFDMLMPALEQMVDKAEKDDRMSRLIIDSTSAPKHSFIDAILNHAEQLKTLPEKIGNIVRNLPENSKDLPKDLQKFLDGERKEMPENNVLGRVIQAHYAVKTGDYTAYGMPEEAEAYLEGGKKDLSSRTQGYFGKMFLECPLLDSDGDVLDQISANDLLKTYMWLSKPAVVEMVRPNLQGAASLVAADLVMFLDELRDYGIDITEFDVPEHTFERLHSDDDLLHRTAKPLLITEKIRNNQKHSSDNLGEVASMLWPDTIDAACNAVYQKESLAKAAATLEF